jgi:hypothetical protein
MRFVNAFHASKSIQDLQILSGTNGNVRALCERPENDGHIKWPQRASPDGAGAIPFLQSSV